MGIHLVGGGWQDEPDGRAYAAFVAEASARGRAAGRESPRVAVVAIREDGADHAAKLVAALEPAGGIDPWITVMPEGSRVSHDAFADVDGIIVGGGLTPAYRDALEPQFDTIRDLVGDGVPYLGFSAGSAIAATNALVGGWLIGGVPVCPEDAAEDLEEVTVLPGIGLIDVSVDVHVAQWGALSRLVAAVEAGLVDAGVGIDENTALIAGTGALRVAGAGSVWKVTASEQGVLVSTIGGTA